MKTFFDSSAFAKRYVEEPGSDRVDRLCLEATELALSVLCIPEVLSALNRRRREGSLSARQYKAAKSALVEDVRDAAIVNLTPHVIARCTTILENTPLRAMDALHVACAVEWQTELFVSADRRQIAAAAKAGLRAKIV